MWKKIIYVFVGLVTIAVIVALTSFSVPALAQLLETQTETELDCDGGGGGPGPCLGEEECSEWGCDASGNPICLDE